MNINDLFKERVNTYFGDKANDFIKLLNEKPTHGFFLNSSKANCEDIFKLIDFDYKKSNLNPNAFYHANDSIGKSIVNELGIIYPQDVESSYSSTFINEDNINLVVDLCAAPGGKSVNIINKYPNALCVCNDVNYKRSLELSKNLERLGLTKTIITNKKPEELVSKLKGNVDFVILDAPCSGEGMIRKYPEILDNYNLDNILNLADIQKDLLEKAYELVKENGLILYSTCTYAYEEDENQIIEFIDKHNDVELIKLSSNNNYSKLEGTIKLCPLNGTEGQFISLLRRKSINEPIKLKYLKSVNNKIVDDFINDNLDLDNYYLYKTDNDYYLSLNPLIDLGYNVIKNGIYLGELKKDRFEPSHSLYRSNELINKYKYVYDLNEDEYPKYINGYEINLNLKDNYYLITYKNLSLGFGKVSKGILKNKYPKGLRNK